MTDHTPDPITPERVTLTEGEARIAPPDGCGHPQCEGTVYFDPDLAARDPEQIALTDAEQIKALLDGHLLAYQYACTCGAWEYVWDPGTDARLEAVVQHRAHVAEVIAREAGEREAALRAGVERVATRMAGEDDGLFADRVTRLSQAAAELRAVLDQGEGDT